MRIYPVRVVFLNLIRMEKQLDGNKLLNNIILLKNACEGISLKAEFEGEGSMFADVSSLCQISKSANVPINIKLAGAEALRDLYELSYLGVDGVIAPMIESPFAVVKFREAVRKVLPIHKFQKVAVLVESKVGIENLPDIVSEFHDIVNTLIVGRGDLLSSLIHSFGYVHDINSADFLQYIYNSLAPLDVGAFKIGMGGKLSVNTLLILKDMPRLVNILDFVETRKVVFPIDAVLGDHNLLISAIQIEKNYITRKMNYYNSILRDESERALLLESRLNASE